jgi:protease YdgD
MSRALTGRAAAPKSGGMIRTALFVVGLSASSAFAEGPAPLAAVGLLDLAGAASCSGTLIAPDLVLTAGHCLMGDVDKTELSGALISFHPGRSPGLPPPEPVQGRIAAAHPIYGFGIGTAAARMGFDFGLLRLEAPIPSEVAVPLIMGPLPSLGDRLVIAGYRGGVGSIARQRSCEVIEANHAFVALGCEVDSGESGSPMMRITDAGPEVVGVLANKGRIEGQPVAFGPVTETAFDVVAQHLSNLELLEIKGVSGGLDAAD